MNPDYNTSYQIFFEKRQTVFQIFLFFFVSDYILSLYKFSYLLSSLFNMNVKGIFVTFAST